MLSDTAFIVAVLSALFLISQRLFWVLIQCIYANLMFCFGLLLIIDAVKYTGTLFDKFAMILVLVSTCFWITSIPRTVIYCYDVAHEEIGKISAKAKERM